MKVLILADQAKADLGRLDRATRLRVTAAIQRMADTGAGNIKELQGIDPPEYRLRVDDFRVRFSQPDKSNRPCQPRPESARRLPLKLTGRPRGNPTSEILFLLS